MLIAIDESGSFVRAPNCGSWCVVAGYTFVERRKTANLQALHRLKANYNRARRQEIKLRDISEQDYFKFLVDLRTAGGALFAVATDGALAEATAIQHHRSMQAEEIRNNVPRMKFDEGKLAVATLANEIDSLSPQLYVQLVCQVHLLSDILNRAIFFYVQRDPKTLRRFVWRIDQKNTVRSVFERAFEQVAPGLIQSTSFRKPMLMLADADYSYFRRFKFTADEFPKYLQEELGHEPKETTNIGKILHEDMTFPDSKHDLSVQIADLLVAGIRRCLRGEFADNLQAARLLGRLMVQNEKTKFPISLVHLAGGNREIADRTASDAVAQMKKHAQPMLCSA